MYQIRKANTGISLVETLISLGILGVVMIPMLFMSSAYFTGQLAKSRQSMDVAHNAAQFSNRLMEELYYAQRILPDSDANTLYFAYYDASKQTEVRNGYRLTTTGSVKVLDKLVFNTTTQAWDVVSPYGTLSADQITLPTTADFEYCIDASATCTAATSEEEAIMVRLNNWTFTKANTSQTLALPEIDIYLSAGALSGGIMLSDIPRQLHSIDVATAMGSNVESELSFLSPRGQRINGLKMNNETGMLSTLVTGESQPGARTSVLSPDGRIYFGENVSPGSFWTWREGYGLSTIVSAESKPGWLSAAVGSDAGRVYFSEDNVSGSVWSWSPTSTGAGALSTVLNSRNYPGQASMAVTGDGRLYFGEIHATNAGFWTWKAGVLTTIAALADGFKNAGWCNVVINNDGSVYYGGNNKTNIYTYTPGNVAGLSTIAPGTSGDTAGNIVGDESLKGFASDGRVYWGQTGHTGSNKFFTYKPGSGWTTIIDNGSAATNPGESSTYVSPYDGRVYFGEEKTAAAGVGGRFWTWKADGTAAGSLTVIIPAAGNVTKPGFEDSDEATYPQDNRYSQRFGTDGRFYFGEHADPGKFWTWKDNGTAAGLFSTIISGLKFPGVRSTMVAPDGRVFFGEATGGSRFFTWKDNDAGGVFSTIISSAGAPGNYRAIAVSDDGRVFFGSGAAPHNFYTWKEGRGLSTILSSGNTPGFFSTWATPEGRVFFGDYSAPGNFYTWKEVAATATMVNISDIGSLTNQTSTVTFTGSPTIVAAVQDMINDLYLVDSAAKTVKRYMYNISTETFTENSSFSWTSYATSVKSAAVDQANNKIALLDTGNRQIDVYTERTTTGSPVPTSYSISSQTTLPTGLTISGRTGNMLVIDSYVYTSGGNSYVDLEVYNDSGVHQRSIPIVVSKVITKSNLTLSAASEHNFKILFDDQKNILYLVAPNIGTSGTIFALAMPYYL